MVTRTSGQKPEWQKKIAKERIEILFAEAEKMTVAGRAELAKRYIEIARKIGMRYNVKLGKENKSKICSSCGCYLLPGKSCSIKKGKGSNSLRVKCFGCDKIIHIPQKSERK